MTERLLIMRHGEAGPGSPDSQRCLTEKGLQEVRRMGVWLAGRDGLADVRLMASPYRRARQSAETIGEALDVTLETLPIIIPDDPPQAVVDWLTEQAGQGPLMLISHMPLVAALTGLLVEGRVDRGINFPTAAVAELEADVFASGCAQLVRFTAPADLV